MDVKKRLCVGGLIALFTHTHTQAQQPKWVVGQSVVDPAAGTIAPNITTGYPGSTQNAIWDENEQLKIYAKDGIIYNANGQKIYPSNNSTVVWSDPNTSGHSEYIFVPMPENCKKFYAIAVDRLVINPAYGTTSYAEYQEGLSEDLYLSYSIIDLNLNNGSGGIELVPWPGNSGLSDSRYYRFQNGRALSPRIDNNHIGVTKARPDGTRFLFVSGSNVMWVFHITSSGITMVLEHEYSYGGNFDLTSELEIFEDNNNYIVANPIIMKDEVPGNTVYRCGMEIFTFDKNTTIGLVNYQFIMESDFYSPAAVIKGLEFSENGEHLYATWFTKNLGATSTWELGSSVSPKNYLLHYERNGGIFLKKPFVALGPNTDDFSYGMIELADDGGLYIAGNGRIGKFSHSNNLTSTPGLATSFNPNAIIVDNELTKHDFLQAPSKISRWSYLLPDQIDGENFMDFNFLDFLPETLTVCEFATLVQTPQTVNWYLKPQKGGAVGVGDLNYLGFGSSFAISSEGSYSISYPDGNGCLRWEDVYIQQEPIVKYGANFTYTVTYPIAYSKDISVNSLLTNVNHIWKVYQKDPSGNWVLYITDYTQSPTFSGLFDPGQVKIEHQIIPLDPINCSFNDIQTTIIQ